VVFRARSLLLAAASVVLGQVILGQASLAIAAVPPNDTIYPNSTKGFVSVVNAPKLGTAWQATQLYQLFQDPVMKPFSEDLEEQLQGKWLAKHAKVGLSIDDLRGIATGELSAGLVTGAKGKTGQVLLADVTGNDAKARDVLAKAGESLIKEKGKQSQKTILGVPVTIYDIPPKEDRKDPRKVVHFLHNGLVGVSNDVDALTEVLARLDGKHNDTLASVGPYQQVMKRLGVAAGTLTPDIRWYIVPLAVAEYRAGADAKKLANVKVMRNQGFGGIQGVGGYVNLSVGAYEILHRTAVYAPKPWEKAMGMLELPNVASLTPPAWVPRDVVMYTSVNWELKTAFEKFSTLFDELFGEGSTGTFDETIESVEKDPNGPGINIRKDLVAHLGTRVSILTDYKLPIDTESERLVFAVETTNEKALAAAVQKSLETDTNVIKRVFGEHIIWEMKSEEETFDAPLVEHPDLVGTAGGATTGSSPKDKLKGRPRGKGKEEETEERRSIPNSAIAVAKGRLFISTHVDFLQKILAGADDREKLAADPDFIRVNAELDKLGATQVCARNFCRADEQFHLTYDLFKAGKLPESQTLMAGLIRQATKDDEADEVAPRKPALDGSKLPDYQVVRRYIGVSGLYATTEDTGWLITGFLFRKDNP
jgi:hypothetical protein